MKKIRIGSKFMVPRPRKPFKIKVTNVTSASVIGLDARGRKWRVPLGWLARRTAIAKSWRSAQRPAAKPAKRRPTKRQSELSGIRRHRGLFGVRVGPFPEDWDWYTNKKEAIAAQARGRYW